MGINCKCTARFMRWFLSSPLSPHLISNIYFLVLGIKPGPYAWQASILSLSFTQCLNTLDQLPGVTVKPYHSQVWCQAPTIPATPKGKARGSPQPSSNPPTPATLQHPGSRERNQIKQKARSRPILCNCPRLNKMFQELGIQLSDGSTSGTGGP